MGEPFALLIRILLGERYKKATPGQRKFGAAFFLFIPLWGGSFVWLMERTFPHGVNGFSVSVFMMVAMAALATATFFWAKLVPEKITWALGGVVWATVLYLALTDRLFSMMR